MKKFLLVAILLVPTLLVCCTSEEDVNVFGDIYGTITDSKSGKPIRNAEVILSPGNKTTVSGSDGHFEFLALEAGQYKVGVNAYEYEYNSRQITVVPGQSTICDFRLSTEIMDNSLQFSTTNLDFGTSHNELSVTITNIGSSEAEWTVNIGDKSWLKATPKYGRIAVGKSQVITFTVDRDFIGEDKAVVVYIAALGNTYPISIYCAAKCSQGELALENTSLNFGTQSTELELKIKNVGNNALSWSISGITTDCLSVSSTEGKLAAGGSSIVKVKLNRDKMQGDLSTSFIVSDGVKEKSVSVTATKNYYADTSISSCDPKVAVQIISCERERDHEGIVAFKFAVTNCGLGDIKGLSGFNLYPPKDRNGFGDSGTVIIDSEGNSYYALLGYYINGKPSYSNKGVGIEFIEDVKNTFELSIQNVPNNITSFKKIQIAAYINNYSPALKYDNILFKNVPIYNVPID